MTIQWIWFFKPSVNKFFLLKKQINVQVYSKTITLPENKAVLTAFAIPEPAPTNPYNYEWSLISGPSMENAGNMENRYYCKFIYSEICPSLATK